MNILKSSAHSAPNHACFGVIVAARSGSSRLPGKALLPLDGVPMIVFLLRRIRPSIQADAIIFATTELPEDDELASIVAKEGFEVYRGANQDVVARYVKAAQDYGLDYLVRITGDCPFVDSASLDYCIARCKEFDRFDLASTKGYFPVGIDYEIYRADMMASLHESGKLTREEREHLTLHFYNNNDSFDIRKIYPPDEWKNEVTFTVDTREDYLFACALAEKLSQANGPVSTITSAQGILHSGIVTECSKPLGDIAIENENWLERDDDILASQKEYLKMHHPVGKRDVCLLCKTTLIDAFRFIHRQVPYLVCSLCGHIQAEELIDQSSGDNFENVYPPLDKAEWQSRCNRIYAPKLEWILKHLDRAGISQQEALSMPWFEIGSGAGYCLGALKSAGAVKCQGIDANSELVSRANQALGRELIVCTHDVATAVSTSTARIYVGFFVLEHLDDPKPLMQALASKPKGTVFAFAVPTYGFATLLEGVFPDHAARSLDGVVHRQLYTDQSISFFLNAIGYTPLAQWVFGQDALDLRRLILRRLTGADYQKGFGTIAERLNGFAESLQQAVDTSLLSDARHIIGIKK